MTDSVIRDERDGELFLGNAAGNLL